MPALPVGKALDGVEERRARLEVGAEGAPGQYLARSQRINQEINALNDVNGQVTAADGLPAGPDMHELVSPYLSTYLLSDGIHPTVAGVSAMNMAGFDALLPLL
jgi:hypothetical protein